MDCERNRATAQLVAELAGYLLSKLSSDRFIVAISGEPGTGKSYLSAKIAEKVNELSGKQLAQIVPMDGFHLTKAQLSQMDNPEEAFRRRGAPWTFDGAKFVQLVARIRESATSTVHAPSFDHAVGDPVADDISVEPHHKIIIIEGLYAHVNEEPWSGAAGLVDERWWISARDKGLNYTRLAQRHVSSGIASDLRAAIERIDSNDRINGGYSEANRYPPARTILN